MKTRNQEQTEIAATIATFPATFGMHAFPGDTFRISPSSSYFTEGTMMLYTERLTSNEHWSSFAKGTASELRREINHRCTCGEGNLPGLAHCEHCPANHVPSVPAVAPVAANDKTGKSEEELRCYTVEASANTDLRRKLTAQICRLRETVERLEAWDKQASAPLVRTLLREETTFIRQCAHGIDGILDCLKGGN